MEYMWPRRAASYGANGGENAYCRELCWRRWSNSRRNEIAEGRVLCDCWYEVSAELNGGHDHYNEITSNSQRTKRKEGEREKMTGKKSNEKLTRRQLYILTRGRGESAALQHMIERIIIK